MVNDHQSWLNWACPSGEWKPSYFTIDEEEVVAGWEGGQSWNGWEVPVFELEAITHWLTATGNMWSYKADTDSIFVAYEDDDNNGDEFKGFDITVKGETKHVYPVGAGSWVWDEADTDECNVCKQWDSITNLVKDPTTIEYAHPDCLAKSGRGQCPTCHEFFVFEYLRPSKHHCAGR